MALYLVVRHEDAEQLWRNAWLDKDRIDAIPTTTEIGRYCAEARANREDVFVHRCGWGEPTICCAAQVDRVDPLSTKQVLVKFRDVRKLLLPPPQTAHEGQRHYHDDPPPTACASNTPSPA